MSLNPINYYNPIIALLYQNPTSNPDYKLLSTNKYEITEIGKLSGDKLRPIISLS
jgi:hypothetical protein